MIRRGDRGRTEAGRSATAEYVPLNFCSSCGRDFVGTAYFDRHRVGKHAYSFAEGMRMDPPREDGRRCLDGSELLATGLQPMSEDEMRESKYASRVGSGVPLWFDPISLASEGGENTRGFAIEGLREAA